MINLTIGLLVLVPLMILAAIYELAKESPDTVKFILFAATVSIAFVGGAWALGAILRFIF